VLFLSVLGCRKQKDSKLNDQAKDVAKKPECIQLAGMYSIVQHEENQELVVKCKIAASGGKKYTPPRVAGGNVTDNLKISQNGCQSFKLDLLKPDGLGAPASSKYYIKALNKPETRQESNGGETIETTITSKATDRMLQVTYERKRKQPNGDVRPDELVKDTFSWNDQKLVFRRQQYGDSLDALRYDHECEYKKTVDGNESYINP
jgi:hypothetical protein